jgi:hypothetical protein
MIHIYAARRADKKAIRLQDEPFDPVLWRQFALADGLMDEDVWFSLAHETDDVEIERIHQEFWLSARPQGSLE